jgi:hypothetical protein
MLCAFIGRPTVADQMNQKQSAADSTLSPLVCSVEMPLTALLVAVRIRRAFELYGTCQYNLETLGKELYRLGLRSKSGREVKISSLSVMLNNSFYIGLIRIQKTNETFVGIHEPIIGKTLFDRVQAVLTGKTNTRSHKHDYRLYKA